MIVLIVTRRRLFLLTALILAASLICSNGSVVEQVRAAFLDPPPDGVRYRAQLLYLCGIRLLAAAAILGVSYLISLVFSLVLRGQLESAFGRRLPPSRSDEVALLGRLNAQFPRPLEEKSAVGALVIYLLALGALVMWANSPASLRGTFGYIFLPNTSSDLILQYGPLLLPILLLTHAVTSFRSHTLYLEMLRKRLAIKAKR